MLIGYVLCVMAGGLVGAVLVAAMVVGQTRRPEPTPEDMARFTGTWV